MKKIKFFKTCLLCFTIVASSIVVTKSKTNEMILTNSIRTESNIDNDLEFYLTKNRIQKYIPQTKEITLSFVGDCTLGTDVDFGYVNTLPYVLDKNNGDYSYFLKNVKDIFEEDDLTIANLETTFTNSNNAVPKKFNFKGNPSYANILLEGDVEIVNLANNHIYDYGDKGYNDTVETLKISNVSYYGENIFLIEEIDGIKIGFAGFNGFQNNDYTTTQIKTALDYFKEKNVDIKVVTFHWGIERENYFNKTQQTLGRYAIDNGADLVVGHHPHVLQGIEEYNGKYIVYSLGNFVFGGNRNPSDKDSMIFQPIFKFENNKLVDTEIIIIPVSISSRQDLNDYQPIILENEQKQKVLSRIDNYSYNFKNEE